MAANTTEQPIISLDDRRKKKSKFISTKEAVKDVIPISWNTPEKSKKNTKNHTEI